MKLTNIILLLIFIFLLSCGNMGKILRNEKVNTTDEFLIKKKDPLILPPDFEKIPSPDTLTKTSIRNEDKFKEIIKESQKNQIKKKTSSSIEDTILNRLPSDKK
jgi:hypothetical protein